jgi:hypothetical protein
MDADLDMANRTSQLNLGLKPDFHRKVFDNECKTTTWMRAN